MDVKTGVVLDPDVLADRVGWLATLTREIAQSTLSTAWSPVGLDAIADPKLPRQGHDAVRRAYGWPSFPAGVYVPSRVLRMSGEIAARLLRGANHQRGILTAMLQDNPPPRGTTRVEIRNLGRSIRSFEREHGHLPVDFFDVRPIPPRAPTGFLPLASTDRQFGAWHEIGNEQAFLDVKLPLVERPASRADWAWARLAIRLPDLVSGRVAARARLSRPSLRVRSNGKIIADLVTNQPAPVLRSVEPQVVFGLDWGERRLLTGADIWVAPDGQARTSGRPVFCDTKGVQRKLDRLRRHAGDLKGRAARYEALTPERPDTVLDEKRARLEAEQERIWARYRELPRQVAHAGAR